MSFPDTMFHMARSHLLEIPQVALPPGYRLRRFREGDGERWQLLQQATEPFIPITADFFERQFGKDLEILPDRMFLVETNTGELAGTITAWWEHDRHQPNGGRGRIHWVAVHPDYQRRGLAKPMMTQALNRLAQEYQGAVLGTSSGRLWAVKVYLDFDFLPDPVELADPRIHAAWQHVQSLLDHPALTQALASGAS